MTAAKLAKHRCVSLYEAAVCAAVILLCSCGTSKQETASVPEQAAEPAAKTEAVSAQPWSTADLIAGISGDDPAEGFNRSMFEVDYAIMEYVARPLGWIWASVLPAPVLRGIENACDNLAFPGRLVSSLGSAEWECAGVETGRFLVNTTVGIGGLFDPAQHWFHWYKTDADFGRMFADWGIQPGCRLILPGMRSVNVRDDTGRVFDYFFDIRTYLPYSSWAYINDLVVTHPRFLRAIKGSADPYRTYVMMSLLNRELELNKWYYEYAKDAHAGRLPEIPPEVKTVKPSGLHGKYEELPGYHSLGPVADTLRAIYYMPQKDRDFWYARLSVFNSDFEGKMKKRRIALTDDKDREKLVYGYWEAPKPEDKKALPRPEKLVIIIPGIGGIYNGQTALATAETFYQAGYSIVLMDSAFNWRFMQATDDRLPGYTPDDAAKQRSALKLILDSLKKDGKIVNPRIVLTGWSMGALQTAFIASMEEKQNTLNISRYLPVNPPVDLLFALRKADSFAEPSKNWTKDEAVQKVTTGAGLQYVMTDRVVPAFDPEKPETFTPPPLVSEDVAGYFIALSLRGSIGEILLKSHRTSPLPSIQSECTTFHREAFYREIGGIGFVQYIERFLKPRYGEKASLDKLAAESGLRAVEKTLRGNEKVRMIHSWDDILINDADRGFLDNALGARMTWFAHGGHCGAFYTQAFRRELIVRAEEP